MIDLLEEADRLQMLIVDERIEGVDRRTRDVEPIEYLGGNAISNPGGLSDKFGF